MNKTKLIRTYQVLAILLIILGIIHCAMVFVYFDSLSTEAVFSLGTGIAVSLLGLLNYVAAKLLLPMLLTVALIANIIQGLYGILSLTVFGDPQALVGLIIFVLLLIVSWLVRSSTTGPLEEKN